MKYLKKELPDCLELVKKIFGGMVESVWAIDPYVEITDETSQEQLERYILDFEERIDIATKYNMNSNNEFSFTGDVDLVIKLTNGTEICFEDHGKPVISNIDPTEEYILL